MSSEVQQPGAGDVSASKPTRKKRGTPKGAFHYRPEGACEAPGCGKPVPGGMVHFRVRGYFCSDQCRRKAYNIRKASGLECEQCRGPMPGNNDRSRTPRFCSRECTDTFRREQQMSGTGPFRSLIETYLKDGTPHYTQSSRDQARTQLSIFFKYVNTEAKISSLDQIVYRVVSRFIAAERARGITTPNPVSLVASFFRWAQEEGLFTRRTPVVPRIHTGAMRTRQPYEDDQMAALWEIVEGSDKTHLKLMFAIGEECGLRNSEVCNIRLADVNLDKQRICVRLPTKNKQPRTVSFHNKVKKFLQEWLLKRDPRCGHDHLFHTAELRVVNNSLLDNWFKQLYGKKPEPAASFEFHRLRHTWATRLVNAGMELPILQDLGGWLSLSSLQIYAKVRPSTVHRSYQEAYSAMEAKRDSREEAAISLMDFALMDRDAQASPTNSAT